MNNERHTAFIPTAPINIELRSKRTRTNEKQTVMYRLNNFRVHIRTLWSLSLLLNLQVTNCCYFLSLQMDRWIRRFVLLFCLLSSPYVTDDHLKCTVHTKSSTMLKQSIAVCFSSLSNTSVPIVLNIIRINLYVWTKSHTRHTNGIVYSLTHMHICGHFPNFLLWHVIVSNFIWRLYHTLTLTRKKKRLMISIKFRFVDLRSP